MKTSLTGKEVRISYNSEYEEYRVTYGDSTYCTSDAADAWDTARSMAAIVAVSSSAKSRIARLGVLS